MKRVQCIETYQFQMGFTNSGIRKSISIFYPKKKSARTAYNARHGI